MATQIIGCATSDRIGERCFQAARMLGLDEEHDLDGGKPISLANAVLRQRGTVGAILGSDTLQKLPVDTDFNGLKFVPLGPAMLRYALVSNVDTPVTAPLTEVITPFETLARQLQREGLLTPDCKIIVETSNTEKTAKRDGIPGILEVIQSGRSLIENDFPMTHIRWLGGWADVGLFANHELADEVEARLRTNPDLRMALRESFLDVEVLQNLHQTVWRENDELRTARSRFAAMGRQESSRYADFSGLPDRVAPFI